MVVDLVRILSEAKPFQREEGEIRDWIAKEKEQLKELSLDVERRQRELDALALGDESRVRLARELDELKLRFRHQVEDRERERAQRIVGGQKRWFAAARRAVAEVARTRDVDVVLQLRHADPNGSQPEELSSEIFLTDVLYCDPSLDITPDVLKILNR